MGLNKKKVNTCTKYKIILNNNKVRWSLSKKVSLLDGHLPPEIKTSYALVFITRESITPPVPKVDGAKNDKFEFLWKKGSDRVPKVDT